MSNEPGHQAQSNNNEDAKSPSSKLESLPREELIKFIKKQMITNQKFKTKCEELTKENEVLKAKNLEKSEAMQPGPTSDQWECMKLKQTTMEAAYQSTVEELNRFVQRNEDLEKQLATLSSVRDELTGETEHLRQDNAKLLAEIERELKLRTEMEEKAADWEEMMKMLERERDDATGHLEEVRASCRRYLDLVEGISRNVERVTPDRDTVSEIDAGLRRRPSDPGLSSEYVRMEETLVSRLEYLDSVTAGLVFERDEIEERLGHFSAELFGRDPDSGVSAESGTSLLESLSRIETAVKVLREDLDRKTQELLEIREKSAVSDGGEVPGDVGEKDAGRGGEEMPVVDRVQEIVERGSTRSFPKCRVAVVCESSVWSHSQEKVDPRNEMLEKEITRLSEDKIELLEKISASESSLSALASEVALLESNVEKLQSDLDGSVANTADKERQLSETSLRLEEVLTILDSRDKMISELEGIASRQDVDILQNCDEKVFKLEGLVISLEEKIRRLEMESFVWDRCEGWTQTENLAGVFEVGLDENLTKESCQKETTTPSQLSAESAASNSSVKSTHLVFEDSGKSAVDLRVALEESRSENVALKDSLERLSLALTSERGEPGSVRDESSASLSGSDSVETDLVKVEEKLEKNRSITDWLQADLDAKQQSTSDLVQNGLEPAPKNVKTKRTESEKRTVELRSATESLNEDFNSLKSELDLAKEHKVLLEETLRLKEIELDSLKSELDNSKQHLNDGELALKDSESKSIEAEKTTEFVPATKTLESLNEDFNSLKLELDSAKEHKVLLEETLRLKEIELDSLKSELDNSKQQLNDRELALKDSESKRIEAEKKTAELESATKTLESLNEDFNSLKSELDSAKEHKVLLEETLKLKEIELDRLKSELDHSKQQLNDGESTLKDLEAKRTEAEKKTAELESAMRTLESLNEDFNLLKSELDLAKEHKVLLEEALRLKEIELDSLKSELDNSKQQLNDRELALKDSESKRIEAEKKTAELESATKTLESLNEDFNSLKSELDSAKEHKVLLEETLKLKEIELDRLKSELDHSKQQLNDGESTLKDLEAKRTEAEKKTAELESAMRTLESLNEDFNSLKSELDSAKEHKVLLEETLKLKEIELDRLKSELDNSEQRLNNGESALKSDLESSRAEVEFFKQENISLRKSVENLSLELESKRSESESVREELAMALSKLDAHGVEFAKAKEELEASRAKMTLLLEELGGLKEKLDASGLTANELVQNRLESVLKDLEAKTIEAEMKTAELESALQALESLNKDFDSLRSELESMEKHKVSLEESLRLKETELTELLSELESSRQHTKAELDTSRANAALLQKEVDALNGRLDEERSSTITMVRDRLEPALKDLDTSRTEAESLRSQLALAKSGVGRLTAELECQKELLSSKTAELGMVRAALVDVDSLRSECELAKSLSVSLEEALKSKEADVDVLRSELEAERRRLNEGESGHKSDLERTVAELESSRHELAELRSQLREKEERESKMKQLILKNKKETSDLRNRLEVTIEELNQVRSDSTNKKASDQGVSMLYQNLQSEYEKLETEYDAEKLIGLDLQKSVESLTAELGQAKVRIAEALEAEDNLREELERREKMLQAMEESKLQLEKEVQAGRIQNDVVGKEKTSLEHRASQLEEQLRQARDQHQSDVRRLEQEVKAKADELDEARKDIQHSQLMSLEIADYERTLKCLRSTVDEGQQEVKSAREELRHERQQREGTVKLLEMAENQYKQSEEQCAKLKQLLLKSKKELTEARKQEGERANSESQLRTQNEMLTQVTEEQKLKMAELAAEGRRLSDRLTTSSESHQRAMSVLEMKLANQQREAEQCRASLDRLQAEYDGYKVRVHNVLKVKKTSDLDVAVLADEKRERERLEQVNAQLKEKILELSNQLSSTNNEEEQLREELDKQLQKQSIMKANHEAAESAWREKLDKLTSGHAEERAKQAETIQQLMVQNESMAQTFKEQHSTVVESLKAQLDKAQLEVDRCRTRLQSLDPSPTSLVQVQSLPGSLNPAGSVRADRPSLPTEGTYEERQAAEGSEYSDEVQHSVKMVGTSPVTAVATGTSQPPALKSSFVPLEVLLAGGSNAPSEATDEDTGKDCDREEKALNSLLLASQRQGAHLRQLLNESEATVLRLTEQATVLKGEIRRLERNQERQSSVSNMEYLKNIVYKFLTLKNVEERLQLVPVMQTMLRFSPEEKEQVTSIAKGTESFAAIGAEPAGWGSYLRWPNVTRGLGGQ